jgi:hypothetical protein
MDTERSIEPSWQEREPGRITLDGNDAMLQSGPSYDVREKAPSSNFDRNKAASLSQLKRKRDSGQAVRSTADFEDELAFLNSNAIEDLVSFRHLGLKPVIGKRWPRRSWQFFNDLAELKRDSPLPSSIPHSGPSAIANRLYALGAGSNWIRSVYFIVWSFGPRG